MRLPPRASARVFVDDLGPGYLERIRQGFEWINLAGRLHWGDTVFIKPNLTFPTYKRGVMTSPACVEQVVVALRDYTNRVVIGEADSGGYNPFQMEEVFSRTGIYDLHKRYDLNIVNLSRGPRRSIYFDYKHRSFVVPLPTLVLDEVDLFVTVPVPKIHMNTGISMAIKNQWGIIPEPNLRLRLHPFFERVIYEVNQALQPMLAVVDGRYGLNRSGPMSGDAVDLNWLLVSDNIYVADTIGCELMRLRPDTVPYLRYITRVMGALPPPESVTLNCDYRRFQRDQFYLERAPTDYPGLFAFKSPTLAYLAYFSPLADLLHRLLYLVRTPFYDYQAPALTADEAAESAADAPAELVSLGPSQAPPPG